MLSRVFAALAPRSAPAPHREADDRMRRYEWLASDGRDAIVEIGVAGRIAFASPNVEAISGHPASSVIGRSIFDYVHADDIPNVVDRLHQAFTEGVLPELRFRFKRADGVYRWLEVYGRSLRRSPMDVRILAAARDITDRYLAEEAARSSEERLMLHVAQTPVGVIGWDAGGRIVEWNPAAETIFGFARDEAIGRIGSTIILPPERRGHWGWTADSWDGEVHSRRTTLEACTRDGRRIICDWHDAPLVASDGSIIGMTSIVEDVTDRLHAQEILRDSEAAIRSLYELTSAHHMDFHGKVEAVVAMGCAFFRLPSGIVAKLDGDRFEIAASHNAHDRFRRGMVLPKASMFSATVLERNETIAIDCASAETWGDHPALRDQGLEVFIGTPVTVGGVTYGVISFAGTSLRSHAFSVADKDFLRLMAQWVGLAIERIHVEEELRHRAVHDALTGLPNQRLLKDRLGVALAHARRSGRPVAVCFLDLDRFKNVNDTLGHRIGDCLLKEVTARLQSCLREGDTLARLGGDEFVVLLPEVLDASAACDVAQRLLDSLKRPVFVEEQEMFVTASIGIALYPGDGDDVDTLVKHADRAMYRAKELGRDSYQLAAATDGLGGERFSLETALRHAVDNGELHVEYQPQIDIASGSLIGFEALVRWHHSQRGLVPPSDFIPLAEETGLIVGIGAWVIEQACRQAAAWRRMGFPDFRMAVNVSPRQFRHKSFVDSVTALLDSHGLDPSLLEIELTESVTMQAGEAELEALQRLKFVGVRLAIDDFGTGYASLSNLKRFPIDAVKVDRSFVRDCLNSTDDAAIVKAVVSMGKALRLQVIAEGIETKEQLAFLQLLGCDAAQGYLIGRPAPPSEIERAVAARSSLRELVAPTNPAA